MILNNPPLQSQVIQKKGSSHLLRKVQSNLNLKKKDRTQKISLRTVRIVRIQIQYNKILIITNNNYKVRKSKGSNYYRVHHLQTHRLCSNYQRRKRKRRKRIMSFMTPTIGSVGSDHFDSMFSTFSHISNILFFNLKKQLLSYQIYCWISN